MFSDLSEQDRTERDAIIAEIHAAFKDVALGEDGISWSECVALDRYETEDEQEAVRRSDGYSHWSKLVDDRDWHPFPGIGGFPFINAEGFRYYLPPTMIRFLRGDIAEWFPGHLLGSVERFTGEDGLWSEEQLCCIARFIAFMARHDEDLCLGPEGVNPWTEALERRWRGYLPRLES